MKIILSDSSIDYKSTQLIPKSYKQINLSFLGLVKYLIFGKNIHCYHFRYLILKGSWKPYVRYTVICTLLSIRKIPIMWSMHNFYEHTRDNESLNKVLRKYLFRKSKAIIVFHESIKQLLPIQVKNKVYVSNFGTMKSNIHSQEGDEDYFNECYSKWQGKGEIDMLIISNAMHNDYKLLIDQIDKKYNILIINKNDNYEYTSENIFSFNGLLYEGLDEVLKNNRRDIIGLIFHDNLSVATSYYLYSDYKIPVITNNVRPNKNIIETTGIGLVKNEMEGINEVIKTIKDNYEVYSKNSENFNKVYNWEKGKEIYNNILNEI